jgi:hypothetical protein
MVNRENAIQNLYDLISHFNDLPKLFDWKKRRVEELQGALWERIYAAQYSDLPPQSVTDQFRF